MVLFVVSMKIESIVVITTLVVFSSAPMVFQFQAWLDVDLRIPSDHPLKRLVIVCGFVHIGVGLFGSDYCPQKVMFSLESKIMINNNVLRLLGDVVFGDLRLDKERVMFIWRFTFVGCFLLLGLSFGLLFFV